MNKTTIFAGVAAGVVWYILGFLFYGMSGLMDGYMTEAGAAVMLPEENINMILLIVAHLVLGIVFAAIYSKWARGTHTFKHGAELGVMVALFFIGIALINISVKNEMSTMGYVVDSIFGIISMAIGGGVCALVFGKMED
ncbi:MAG: DUF1761 family protein [Saprospiraceae bacterium]|nr:DUF1761 family protein [Saprospiraceae bacterium]